MKIFPNYSDDIKKIEDMTDYLTVEFLKIREQIKEISKILEIHNNTNSNLIDRIEVLEENKPSFQTKEDGLNIADKERILLLEMEVSKFKNLLIEKTPRGREVLSKSGKIFRTKYNE